MVPFAFFVAAAQLCPMIYSFHLAPTSFLRPGVDMDLGLSNGSPRARSHTRDEHTPTHDIHWFRIKNQPEAKCTKKLTKRPADSEQDGVVVHLLHSVVLQRHARVRIHIGPGVLDLARLEQDRRHEVVELADQLEQGIVG